MTNQLEFLPGGSVTSPSGFQAGAVSAGIKKNGALDLAVLASDVPCSAAGLFTKNRVKAAPVMLCQERIARGKASVIVVNAGCANACTGEAGRADAAKMAALAARRFGISDDEVLVASTGVIGTQLPMDRIRSGISQISLTAGGGHDMARAMMTTDTRPKEVAIKSIFGITIAGVAKGAGMIHPDMATMLSFLTTDAAVEPGMLASMLKRAADVSFNMVSVDGDTSTNDTLLLLANGLSGKLVTAGSDIAEAFQDALDNVCIYLAKAIARDGEGATKLIEVRVEGAVNPEEARRAARTVATSPLVKAAVHGSDPNWGRVLAAVGRSGVAVEPSRVDLYIGEDCLFHNGVPQAFDPGKVIGALKQKEIPIQVKLNLGSAGATAWGCDLSEEYVTINSQYTT